MSVASKRRMYTCTEGPVTVATVCPLTGDPGVCSLCCRPFAGHPVAVIDEAVFVRDLTALLPPDQLADLARRADELREPSPAPAPPAFASPWSNLTWGDKLQALLTIPVAAVLGQLVAKYLVTAETVLANPLWALAAIGGLSAGVGVGAPLLWRVRKWLLR